VYAKKNEPNSEEGYFTIDHTATVYLMAKGNRLSATIGFGESHDSAVAKLRRLISSAE